MYKDNDYLVYGKDVCKVFEITKENNISYYLLRPLKDQSLKIKVPTTSNKKNLIIIKNKLKKILNILN